MDNPDVLKKCGDPHLLVLSSILNRHPFNATYSPMEITILGNINITMELVRR